MNNKVLTISVAAYNVEDYLEKNLLSIINSGCIDKIEVFVVDDGGTDQSLEIAQKYEKQFPSSIHAVHKANGGYGSTVNYSIQHAAGKYIRLLDGDDWVDSNGLHKLIEFLESDLTNTDIVVTPYCKYIGHDIVAVENFPRLRKQTEYAVSSLPHNTTVSMWALTYKTSIVRLSGLVLPEHTLYTDQLFATIPFIVSKSIVFLDFTVYCYRLGRDGQSVSRESRIRNIQDALSNCFELAKFCAAHRTADNYEYISYRVAGIVARGVKTILLLPINKENLHRLVLFEQDIKTVSPDVYNKETKSGKTGLLVKMLRVTKYQAYWAIKLLPDGIPNWN